jgi:subtilisin family serine protease
VSILDSGIDPNHLDIKGRLDFNCSRSFDAREPGILDHNFHGTFVSSEVVSNGIGMASVAPDARLCAVKVLGRTGFGTFSAVIAGIIFASSRSDVINMSLGAYFHPSRPDERALIAAVQRAVNIAHNTGVFVAASAGNDGVRLRTATAPQDSIDIPCQLVNVVCVGATGPVNQRNFNRRASYSNFGFQSNGNAVDLFAPGGDFLGVNADWVLGACARLSSELDCSDGENHYALAVGTSQASPQVAGAAAVLVSQGLHDPDRIARCLFLSAYRLGSGDRDPIFGHGALSVRRAVNFHRQGRC